MPKVKLFLIITQSAWGGAQKYVFDLATNLKKYDVTVGVGSGGELIPKLKKSGVKVIEIPELVRSINPVKDVQAVLETYQLIKSSGFQIVHTNSSKAGVVGRLAARLAGVKAVTYTVHGLVLNEPMNFPVKAVYWLMEKVGSLCSGKIITVSQMDKDSVIRYGLKEASEVQVIPIGVEKMPIGSTSHDGFVVGTIANFYPTKGYRYYLPAISETLKIYPEIKFELVGVGPDEMMVRGTISKLGIGRSVTVINDKTTARKRLSGFDIFVLPSVKEGMPYTIVEAMQAGLPIIATKVGGVPEEISDGKSGLLVPPGDSESLSAALVKLINDEKLRSRLGQTARRESGKFTVTRMVESTAKFYRELTA